MNHIWLALLSLTVIGCATKAPAPPAPERTTASTPSSITLNIQANEIKEVAILDDTASTLCSPGAKDHLDQTVTYFACATTVKVGIRVVSPHLNIDRVQEGIAEHFITGYGSRAALGAQTPDAEASRELKAIQMESLSALGRRYRKLADGCMGESVALTYGGDRIDLQTGEYFGDLRCRIKRKNAKVTAGVVYYLELAKGPAFHALNTTADKMKEGARIIVEADKQHGDNMGFLVTDTKRRLAERFNQGVALADRSTAPMREYIAATIESLNQAQQRTRMASAEILKSWGDKIRP